MEEENSRRSIEEENSQCSIEEENSQRSNGLDWDDFNNEEQGVSTEMFEELLSLGTATSDCVQQSTLLLDLYIATHSLEHPLALLSLLIPHWHNLACTVLYEGRLQTLLQLDQEQFKHWNLELIDLLLDDSRYNLNLDCNITTLWNPVYESVNRSQLKALSHLLLQACTKQKMNPVVLHYKKCVQCFNALEENQVSLDTFKQQLCNIGDPVSFFKMRFRQYRTPLSVCQNPEIVQWIVSEYKTQLSEFIDIKMPYAALACPTVREQKSPSGKRFRASSSSNTSRLDNNGQNSSLCNIQWGNAAYFVNVFVLKQLLQAGVSTSNGLIHYLAQRETSSESKNTGIILRKRLVELMVHIKHQRMSTSNTMITSKEEKVEIDRLVQLRNEPQNCTICLDNTEEHPLQCGHYFHAKCLSEGYSLKCPLCRKAIEGVPAHILGALHLRIARRQEEDQLKFQQEMHCLQDEYNGNIPPDMVHALYVKYNIGGNALLLE